MGWLPNNPDDNANKGEEEGDEGKGQAQEKPQRPAFTILPTAAAHILLLVCFGSMGLPLLPLFDQCCIRRAYIILFWVQQC